MSAPPSTKPAALPKGHSIAEYEVVRVLGAGGFGITYLAFDHQLDGPVAIKEYFPAELATREDGDQVAATGPTNRAALATAKSGTDTFAWGLERFLEEARAVDRFRHPNVVQARRYLEANGTAYLVMEYVEGESLKSVLDRRESLSAEEWRPWMDALLEGLEHVHAHGYLHRDIKPANIVVRSEDGEPVLIDFGSARLQHRDRTHTQVLSAAYAPIEQHSTGVTQGPPTDIYALAATSYRALTGTPVSSAPDRILNDDYVPLADHLGGTDGQWLAAIDHGLAVRPENRPQTVEAWRAELGTEGGAAPPKSSTGPTRTAEPSIRTGTQPTGDSVDAPSRPARLWLAVAAVGALLLFGAAVALVLSSLDTGNSEAHYLLGEEHYHGDGTAPDYGAAMEWYRKAADQGHAQAQFKLGWMYDNGEGVPQDDGEAVVWYRKAADQGLADAQYWLGRMYDNGHGVPQDYGGAVAWYRKAADQGLADAQYWLGRMYDNGHGVPQDYREAVAWYRKAADQGLADAQYVLGAAHYFGNGAAHDYGEAVAWLRKAADQGEAIAQVSLGYLYFTGEGVPQDLSEAVVWYRKAADQGNTEAQSQLGLMYSGGDGVPQNYAEAAAWFRKAAEQEDATAQVSLGNLYYTGEGVTQDYGEAATWYRKAANQGHVGAQLRFAGMSYQGLGVLRDYGEAAAYFHKAANQGDATAQRALGNMYSTGQGVAQNDIHAYAWWNIAAAQGDEEAKESLDLVGRRMSGAQVATAQRISRDLVPQ